MLFREVHRKYSGVALLVATFVCALLWARANDPFERRGFSIETRDGKRVKGVAVLPRPVSRHPVVILVPGSVNDLRTSGRSLRQLAELGLAAVVIEYENPSDFDGRFSALLEYVRIQSWAQNTAVAWLGQNIGAQMTLGFAIAHPDLQPQLLVQLAGGWAPGLPDGKELEKADQGIKELESSTPRKDAHDVTPTQLLHCQVLFVHGRLDEVVPVDQLAKLLRDQRTRVDVRIVEDQAYEFGANADLLFRFVAEYCARFFGHATKSSAVDHISSWYYWVPALLAVSGWFFRSCRRVLGERASGDLRPSGFGERLFRLAGFLALIALIQSALHLVLPELSVRGPVISLARAIVVPRLWRAEYDFLATDPGWAGQPLRALLDHAELSNLQRRQFYTNLTQTIYRKYVLSPRISVGELEDWNWRRKLWEAFYPRVRKEQDPFQSAQTVVRFLRERVEVRPSSSSPAIAPCWERGLTDEKGFERLYVAALRSVGIACRLNELGQAVVWSGETWQSAPRPIAFVVQTSRQRD